MTVYFDKANLEVFAGRKNESIYPDCLRMVQRDLDKGFNFTKDELKENADLLAWYQANMVSNLGNTSVKHLTTPFPTRPLKSNSHIAFVAAQLASVYLIDDEKIDVFKASGAVLTGKPGECLETLAVLFLGHNDYRFERRLRIRAANDTTVNPPGIRAWSELEAYTAPVCDILIIDKYVLSDPALLEANLSALLKALIVRCRSKINIVIYTSAKDGDVKIDFSALRSKLSAAVNSVTGKGVELTLIKVYDQKGVASKAEHDRTILTNYARVYSGDSLGYWLVDGRLNTKGRELSIASLAEPDN